MIPSILLALYIATNPLSDSEWKIMASVLKNEFGETCYMSCGLLKSNPRFLPSFILINTEAKLLSFTVSIPVPKKIVDFSPLDIIPENSNRGIIASISLLFLFIVFCNVLNS